MNPTKEEIKEIEAAIKNQFLTEVKRRAVERLMSENADRIESYIARIASRLSTEIAKEFPL